MGRQRQGSGGGQGRKQGEESRAEATALVASVYLPQCICPCALQPPVTPAPPPAPRPSRAFARSGLEAAGGKLASVSPDKPRGKNSKGNKSLPRTNDIAADTGPAADVSFTGPPLTGAALAAAAADFASHPLMDCGTSIASSAPSIASLDDFFKPNGGAATGHAQPPVTCPLAAHPPHPRPAPKPSGPHGALLPHPHPQTQPLAPLCTAQVT